MIADRVSLSGYWHGHRPVHVKPFLALFFHAVVMLRASQRKRGVCTETSDMCSLSLCGALPVAGTMACSRLPLDDVV